MNRLIDAERVTEGKFHSMPMLQKYSDRNLAYMYGWNDALDAVAENAPTVEEEVRLDAKDFYNLLKNPITLDALVNAKDKYTVLAILKRQMEQMRGVNNDTERN